MWGYLGIKEIICTDSKIMVAIIIILIITLGRITNSDISDTQWLQASLPIKDGGLGVRRIASLALPAFLASAASTVILQDTILANHPCPAATVFTSYLSTWSSHHVAMSPAEPLPHTQSFWDRPGLLADRTSVETALISPQQKAAFLAAAAPHSGDWLLALPLASCGLRLDDEAVRVAVGLRLGLALCTPHPCRCGANVDAHGIHAFVCKHAAGRTSRHHVLNDVVAWAIASAGIPVYCVVYSTV
jgi:hypothetical protein